MAVKAEKQQLRKPATPKEWRAFWHEFERFGAMLHANGWIFAKTMPQNPHYYTLRRRWERDEDFVWAVEFLRRAGYRSKYGKTWYTQIDVNEHFYWTMGAPINTRSGEPCTILINRKLLSQRDGRTPAPYDAIADRYDTIFTDEESKAEDRRVFDEIGPLWGCSVLDVGCGTGLVLGEVVPADRSRYIGLDPSQKMLDKLQEHYQDAQTVCTPLSGFMPPVVDGVVERFDRVIALYGVGSYLSDAELARIPMLLKPGGRAAVMFYKPGYTPRTYVETGVSIPHRSWHEGLFPGTVHEVGNHVLVIYDRPARKD